MRCPIDDTELKIAERQGIEIDYCPQCRGIWLDRGELDKIIERSSVALTNTPRADYQRDDNSRRYDDDDRPYEHKKRKRGESFLSDLFDF